MAEDIQQALTNRLRTQLMMAASYGMTYESLFNVVQQTVGARQASAADTTPATDPDALVEWPEAASEVEEHMTAADAEWIAQYHADALNDDKENEQ